MSVFLCGTGSNLCLKKSQLMVISLDCCCRCIGGTLRVSNVVVPATCGERLVRARRRELFRLEYRKNTIESSTEVTFLGVKIDKQLQFKSHTEELCRKEAYKLHALRRIRKYLTVEKTKLLANAFINSQFTYAPLILMFAGKLSIAKICEIHFRTLQVVYNNYDKSYHDL